ncbi:BQ2448_5766 [Microbotryum intermedium]|uniref:BQ2448_5766 protein n=1 Tax=Microbotryum intermedium TaxID=269621 RepID=A0A238EZ53_9BASI|nr:BQ2448_5766 [Microbotryum intermedium]
MALAGSITDWDSKTVIGSKARAPTVTKDGAALNAARRSGAAIDTDKKTSSILSTGAGNKIPGVDHAKIAKLDRENEVAPPPTVSLELGKVLQQARQNFKDADGNPKPMSQGDLAKAINQKQTVIQEYENMRAKPDPALLGKMERVLKVKLRGSGIGQPLGGPKKK